MTAKPRPSAHDTVATRLAQILMRLNNGEKLDPHQLAEEFGVSLRTIQRDFLERLAFLPLTKEQQHFVLEPHYFSKLGVGEIQNFAALSGIKALFPILDNRFLRELFDSQTQQAYLVNGYHYEDLSDKTGAFKQLEQAIIKHQLIHFSYKGKSYRNITPYKLVNNSGIWYLAANDGSVLKAFCFSKLEALQVDGQQFVPDPHTRQKIEQDGSIWFSAHKREVVLKIDHSAAAYFKRRQLLPNQHIDKELEDGGLIVSSRIAHDEQILPLIQYWLPHVHIISPTDLHEALVGKLSNYLAQQAVLGKQ